MHKVNLYSVWLRAPWELWQRDVLSADAKGVLDRLRITGGSVFLERVRENQGGLEAVLNQLKLTGTRVGQAINNALPWMVLYLQVTGNADKWCLPDAKLAWKRICAFPEVEAWGVDYPGDLVDGFSRQLVLCRKDLDRALARQAKDIELRKLLALNMLVLQRYRWEMMTSKCAFQAVRPRKVKLAIVQPRVARRLA